MTKREMFLIIANFAGENQREDIVEFCKKEIKLLDKRNSKDSKAKQAKQEERENLAAQILEVLAGTTTPMRTMEIATTLGISPQKATPILKKLTADNKVTTDKIKGATVYAVAA